MKETTFHPSDGFHVLRLAEDQWLMAAPRSAPWGYGATLTLDGLEIESVGALTRVSNWYAANAQPQTLAWETHKRVNGHQVLKDEYGDLNQSDPVKYPAEAPNEGFFTEDEDGDYDDPRSQFYQSVWDTDISKHAIDLSTVPVIDAAGYDSDKFLHWLPSWKQSMATVFADEFAPFGPGKLTGFHDAVRDRFERRGVVDVYTHSGLNARVVHKWSPPRIKSVPARTPSGRKSKTKTEKKETWTTISHDLDHYPDFVLGRTLMDAVDKWESQMQEIEQTLQVGVKACSKCSGTGVIKAQVDG